MSVNCYLFFLLTFLRFLLPLVCLHGNIKSIFINKAIYLFLFTAGKATSKPC